MNEIRWKTVKDNFLSALEKNGSARTDFLDEVCSDDETLREEIESLLDSHEDAEGFIERAAFEIGDIFSFEPDQTHSRFGNYKIIREIGHGGMGAVFLAERNDGEFDQQVAIKIIRQAVAESEIIRRFKRERQILAKLNHPNIAKLLDGGVSANGQPFLAMEFIDGEPITDFINRENLSLNDRLRIFLKVCSAVGYAHQNLTVHRDIKPSNILVTNDGEPKLLDFGLAKLLDDKMMSAATQTQTAFRAMTPAYASPEQMQGDLLTTTSDIYSLGIVLFELLTGERPFNYEGKSLDEIIRTVARNEPPLPSSTSTSKFEILDRGSAVKNYKLLGDLDNIVLMALRKEPVRRYPSVESFADDIERYLRGLPVAARPNTLKYRVSKFIIRHKAGVLAAALILLSLIGGIIASVREARIAEQEKEKAESVNAFLEQTLKYSNPFLNNLRKNGNETNVNEALDEAARRLENGELDRQPEVKAELESTIATIYLSQGKHTEARKFMERYVLYLRESYHENHPKMISGMSLWAALVFYKGELTEAENIYRRYLPLLRDEYQKGSVKADFLGGVLNDFAYLRRTQGDSHEAEIFFRQTLELMPEMSDEGRRLSVTTRSTLASVLADQGRFAEALETARKAVEEYQQRDDTDSPGYGFSLNILGGFLTEKGEFAEADDDLKKAETIFRKYISPTSLWFGDNFRNQAILRYFQGRFLEAIEKADETLRNYEESFGKHYDNYPTALIVKGLSLTKTGQMVEGEKNLREALRLRMETLSHDHYWVAVAKSALGECLATQRRFEEAEPLLLESYESLKTSQGINNPRTLLAQSRLSELYKEWRENRQWER